MGNNPLSEYLQDRVTSPGKGSTDSDDIGTGQAIGIIIGTILLGILLAVLVFGAASGLIAIAITGITSALAGDPIDALVLGMQLVAGVTGVALIWRVVATRRKQTLSLDLKGLL
jgi:hypothetical protein